MKTKVPIQKKDTTDHLASLFSSLFSTRILQFKNKKLKENDISEIFSIMELKSGMINYLLEI